MTEVIFGMLFCLLFMPHGWGKHWGNMVEVNSVGGAQKSQSSPFLPCLPILWSQKTEIPASLQLCMSG